MDKIENTKVEFNIHPKELLTCWNSVKTVINNEVPTTPQDTAFLMEVLGDLANRHKPKAHDPYKVSLPYRKWRAVWFCLNIVIENKMVPSEAHAVPVCEFMSKLAILLDQVTDEEAPQEIEQST